MLEGELSDPRIGACYVTEVVLAPGGKSCRVFIAVQGDAREEEDTLAGLTAARAYIRTEIRDRMGVRHVPELSFAIDRSEKFNARMNELLGRMDKRRKKLERKLGGEKAVGGKAVGQGAVGGKVMGQGAVGQGAVGGKAVGQGAVGGKAVGQGAVGGKVMGGRLVGDAAEQTGVAR